MRNSIAEWVETLRIAPPFSKRRRDLLASIAEADADLNNPGAWVEVHRPDAIMCCTDDGIGPALFLDLLEPRQERGMRIGKDSKDERGH